MIAALLATWKLDKIERESNIKKWVKEAIKNKKSKISGKIRGEIRKNSEGESSSRRAEAKTETEVPSLRKTRGQETFKGNLALQKMQKKIRVERILLK